jgi:hypothetical protein
VGPQKPVPRTFRPQKCGSKQDLADYKMLVGSRAPGTHRRVEFLQSPSHSHEASVHAGPLPSSRIGWEPQVRRDRPRQSVNRSLLPCPPTGHTAGRPRTRPAARHREPGAGRAGVAVLDITGRDGLHLWRWSPHLPRCASAFIRAEHVRRSRCEGHVRAAGAPRRGPRLCDARGRTRAPQRSTEWGRLRVPFLQQCM